MIFSALVLVALFALTPYIYGIKGPVDSVGFIPFTELRTDLYLDEFQGGLYPDGKNFMPREHFLAGVLRGQSIGPLDTDGNPDPNGKMVLMSLGFSNPSQEWCNHDGDACSEWTFTGQAEASPDVNHDTLAIVNGAFPGNGARRWLEPEAEAYERVLVDELPPAGLEHFN